MWSDLRRWSERHREEVAHREMREPFALTRSASLTTRVALLSATVVAVSVSLMAAAAYFVVYRAMYNEVDRQLESRADGMTALSRTGALRGDPQRVVSGAVFSTNISVALIRPDGQTFLVGSVPFEAPERRIARSVNRPGQYNQSLRTIDDQRVLARKLDRGYTLIMSQSLLHTERVLKRLAWVLLVVGGGGVALAALAGTTVARTGLRPVARLTRAAERVARTEVLDPIPVSGNDELARLTESFNTMLAALQSSRDKQARLVADAGHELKTPLTSLRTNVELLIASAEPGAPTVPLADMIELRSDIVAQIEELSTLVGDLVDLSREDVPEVVHEEIDMLDIIDRSLERARRRRNDVEFDVDAESWFVFGEEAGLSRAVLNVLDNAAKWSPGGHHVEVRLRQTAVNVAVLTVADAGPGIPAEDRELVFERFYRSAAARSMPGSGLGLAIVRQVVERIGGTVTAAQSPQGGALIAMALPGHPIPVGPPPVVVRQ
ncbi:MAG TPA: HAMP domain-containing sensor histidine kinase [Gordonia sp. (in: high G+C Gram-positive bacteria)]|uniref:sensor histidine kinase n=1 Tax=unclassified Gordonia (in: high G+C Gram-positive bacteria) TaxID=2657482 RepID=UPI0025BC0894|nr:MULTISPECIES: HAMP domain-containing sensor histidine kinase [unclassified Gordonia (in: high G+C Gram-positive bacteria)]HNP57905.1 HAMP domain-containing sensor histidine kinase [Gordonia sp. (in: high G+C Gram-positive bacteria)]HRC51502.1 HAMP domain-containing sensor histidine kinase [Gordonia sp. (in: high G+C Gram-positive bacteria)]